MGKIFNLYENDVDKTWYNSSNIKYSECDDITNDLKKLRIVFNDGRRYEYNDVDVNDYLKFRESHSQGKALKQYILKYNVNKLNDIDNNLISSINEELDMRMNVDFIVDIQDRSFTIKDNYDNVLYISPTHVLTPEVRAMLISVLNITNVKYKIK